MDDPSKMKLFSSVGGIRTQDFQKKKKSVADRVDTDFGIVGQFSRRNENFEKV